MEVERIEYRPYSTTEQRLHQELATTARNGLFILGHVHSGSE